jgi:ABC-2 type transport system permease protein
MSTPDTNFSNAGAPAAVVPPVSGVAHRSMLQILIMLIRRELWEHRSLWIAPLVVAVLLVLSAFPIHIGHGVFGAHEPDFASADNRQSRFALMVWGQSLPQYLVMVIVVSFYLLDCLFSERRDRSILFWKSLPVSDAATVISKLVVAVVVVPLGVYLAAMVTDIAFQAIWAARVASGSLPDIAVAWDSLTWLKVQGLMLYGLLISMLWYAPLAASLLLVSVWARKNAFLWATLPLLIAVIVEKSAFGTHYVLDLLKYRTWGIWDALAVEVDAPESHGRVVSLTELFDNIPMSRAFLNIDLWLGIAMAAALVFVAIRIRRYRDDT